MRMSNNQQIVVNRIKATLVEQFQQIATLLGVDIQTLITLR